MLIYKKGITFSFFAKYDIIFTTAMNIQGECCHDVGSLSGNGESEKKYFGSVLDCDMLQVYVYARVYGLRKEYDHQNGKL